MKEMIEVLEGYITVQEASEMANVTEGYIRRMLIHNKFKNLIRGEDYIKLGRIWLINKKSWIYYAGTRKMKKDGTV